MTPPARHARLPSSPRPRALRAGASIALASAILIGCSKTASRIERELATPAIGVPVPRADAPLQILLVAGEPAVIVADAGRLPQSGEVRMRLDDGTVIQCEPIILRLRHAGPEQAADPTSMAARMGQWLGLGEGGRAYEWTTEPAKRQATLRAGAAALYIQSTPAREASAPRESTGTLGDQRVNVRWLDRSAPIANADTIFARPLDEAAWQSGWVQAALQVADASPLARWRARLARGTLAAAAAPVPPVMHTRIADPAIEALAGTVEHQWVAAIGAIAAEDPILARRLVERLCATIDFGGGVIVPAWEPEGPDLNALLASLLDPRPGSALRAATAWLDAAPPFVWWVVDDAADAGPGRHLGTVGVANLTGTPFAAWPETPARPGATPEITAVSPRTVRRVSTGATDEPDDDGAPSRISADKALKGVRTTVHVGEGLVNPTVYAHPIPALAPGITVAPFHRDWNLAEWLSADERLNALLAPWALVPPSDALAATGIVYRGVDAPLETTTTAAPDRWLLYVEITNPVGGAASPAADVRPAFVRVFLGSFGRSVAVLRILEDGRVLDDSPPQPTGPARDLPRVVRIIRTPRGWSCWLPIPPSSIDANAILKLGIECVDTRGVRTSWPRPSLPWQQEPSRVSIDTAAWGESK